MLRHLYTACMLLPTLFDCAGARGPSIAQIRIARPTSQLDAVVRFYRDGLGLPVIGGFEGHAGYDGVMIGLPGPDRQLELTSHPGHTAAATPGPEDLLVLYYPDQRERDAVVARLDRMGYHPVAPENPYWIGKAITVPDPDGWRVVLFHGTFHLPAAGAPARWRVPTGDPHVKSRVVPRVPRLRRRSRSPAALGVVRARSVHQDVAPLRLSREPSA